MQTAIGKIHHPVPLPCPTGRHTRHTIVTPICRGHRTLPRREIMASTITDIIPVHLRCLLISRIRLMLRCRRRLRRKIEVFTLARATPLMKESIPILPRRVRSKLELVTKARPLLLRTLNRSTGLTFMVDPLPARDRPLQDPMEPDTNMTGECRVLLLQDIVIRWNRNLHPSTEKIHTHIHVRLMHLHFLRHPPQELPEDLLRLIPGGIPTKRPRIITRNTLLITTMRFRHPEEECPPHRILTDVLPVPRHLLDRAQASREECPLRIFDPDPLHRLLTTHPILRHLATIPGIRRMTRKIGIIHMHHHLIPEHLILQESTINITEG
mmetsp:Transcript_8015/g.16646  ORF Transcript_8015/g.16646 Transcript_8015/m.16646 type:complete len:325 (+) Transcript_8015:531-1505(+)